MSVFRNYNSTQAGGVNANAFPRVYPIPWVPTQRNIRANPGIPTQPQRIQPHERGTFFPTSASGGGTLAPQMCSGSSSGCGCGGGTSIATNPNVTTASQLATDHTFPVSGLINRSRSGMAGLGSGISPRSNAIQANGGIRGTARMRVPLMASRGGR